MVGVAFLMFLPMAGERGNTTPLLALVGILSVFGIAELLLSPVGLSLSTKLAPKAFHTQMVVLNFLSIALGTATAGSLASFYNVGDAGTYFAVVGGAAVAFGMLIALASPFIRRLRSDVH
ncbi:proton-dependent oligopeptide transporter, POT family [Lentzea xinjiangensis]|uniref:Proton-dependent oligopeptide transporter, POT family n=1 Tax=Lentzea xinjiangensis TaxID=402600 RepID=A0A1H9JK45_9PSEU|nr:proton-dependent oligopeptide transporter, POT family [Lentzea xinjiangensis]